MLQLTHPLAIIDLETTGINLGTDRDRGNSHRKDHAR